MDPSYKLLKVLFPPSHHLGLCCQKHTLHQSLRLHNTRVGLLPPTTKHCDFTVGNLWVRSVKLPLNLFTNSLNMLFIVRSQCSDYPTSQPPKYISKGLRQSHPMAAYHWCKGLPGKDTNTPINSWQQGVLVSFSHSQRCSQRTSPK